MFKIHWARKKIHSHPCRFLIVFVWLWRLVSSFINLLSYIKLQCLLEAGLTILDRKKGNSNPPPPPPPHTPPPPPQKKSFPIFDLGERGGLGLPFILSKIVAWYFNISLEGVLFSTVAANVLQVSQFNWSLPLFTHISQGEGRGSPVILSHYSLYYACTSTRITSLILHENP